MHTDRRTHLSNSKFVWFALTLQEPLISRMTCVDLIYNATQGCWRTHSSESQLLSYLHLFQPLWSWQCVPHVCLSVYSENFATWKWATCRESKEDNEKMHLCKHSRPQGNPSGWTQISSSSALLDNWSSTILCCMVLSYAAWVPPHTSWITYPELHSVIYFYKWLTDAYMYLV